jgi:hypothetical protein
MEEDQKLKKAKEVVEKQGINPDQISKSELQGLADDIDME